VPQDLLKHAHGLVQATFLDEGLAEEGELLPVPICEVSGKYME
jgi:hypothetical protein